MQKCKMQCTFTTGNISKDLPSEEGKGASDGVGGRKPTTTSQLVRECQSPSLSERRQSATTLALYKAGE